MAYRQIPASLQRVSDVESQVSDEQAKTMRLEVTIAELQQRLSKMDELEKELEHHRYEALANGAKFVQVR